MKGERRKERKKGKEGRSTYVVACVIAKRSTRLLAFWACYYLECRDKHLFSTFSLDTQRAVDSNQKQSQNEDELHD